MATVYHDADADLSRLKDRLIGVIGYGNQGRAQSLNLRDSGLSVIVGCPQDKSREQAQDDGFEVYDVAPAADASDIILMLIPDEVQPAVYAGDIRPGLRDGDALCFASGYNVHFETIELPPFVDVVMVAPRMIGESVRSLFVDGQGFPCFIAAHQDASGAALQTAVALARGIGGTRAGALESSFEEETLIDLFAEQFLWAGIVRLCQLYYDLLVEAGCSPEAVATDLYLSGELAEVAQAMRRTGFFKQLDLHSHTSQYGQLSRGDRIIAPAVVEEAKKVLAHIRDGGFAGEWKAEQEAGKPTLTELKRKALAHPLNEVETRLFEMWQ
ncbi:MAG: ketol-acid reductoisomerase [Planctomycetota bacterium]|jgi:ketol-acid reductoisomerase